MDRRIAALESSDAAQSFDAVFRLQDLGGERAAQALTGAARTNPDALTRAAAAKALGEMKAVDAVPVLIEMLADEDSLVRLGASEALGNITLRSTSTSGEAAGASPADARKDWAEWWRQHEQEVRRGLGQGR